MRMQQESISRREPKAALMLRLVLAMLMLTLVPACGRRSLQLPLGGPYTAVTWGANQLAELGEGTLSDSTVAVTGPSSESFVEVAAGDFHVLALNLDGTVTAWGSNDRGALGANLPKSYSGPVQVVVAGGVPLSGIIAIDAGVAHSVALRNDGTVFTWGANNYGQLGWDTMSAPKFFAAPVPGVSNVTQIAAGSDHTLACLSDGTVVAWGKNTVGELGVDSFTTQELPTSVHAPGGIGILSGVISVFAGRFQSFALLQGGGLLAWGSNNTAQLGLNDTTNRKLPTPVPGLPAITEVASGLNHTVALDAGSAVWSWGLNDDGQLGNGSNSSTLFPIQVSNAAGTGFLSGVASVSSGWYHSAARLQDGTVLTWGDNDFAALGDGSRTDRLRPVPLVDGSGQTVSGVVALFSGAHSNVVLSSRLTFSLRYPIEGDNQVSTRPYLSWDRVSNAATYRVQVSTAADFSSIVIDQAGLTVPRLLCPIELMPGTTYFWKASALDAGGQDVVAPTASRMFVPAAAGRMLAYGSDFYGQLGNGSGPESFVPVDVLQAEAPDVALAGAVQMAAGRDHSLALMADGTVRAWGKAGTLGNGSGSASELPVTVQNPDTSPLTNVTQVSAGDRTSLALLANGSVRTWGYSHQGGAPTNYAVDVNDVSGPLAGVAGVACGTNHSAAWMSDGTVRTWGWNTFGQLGDGTNNSSDMPVTVQLSPGAPLTGVIQVVCGDYHCLALRNDGTVWGWGRQQDQTGLDTPTPTIVQGLGGVGTLNSVRWIATTTPNGSDWHALAVLQNDTAVAWGINDYGEFGIGTEGTSAVIPIPAPVVDEFGQILQGIQSMAAGEYRSVAVMKDGTARVWGLQPSTRPAFSQVAYAMMVLDRFGVPVTGVGQAAASRHVLLRR